MFSRKLRKLKGIHVLNPTAGLIIQPVIPKSFKFLTSASEQNESLRSRLNSSDGDLSKDDHVANLENSIKNYEMRQNHSKIALQNLEKSISTYHEKLEILEGVVTGNFYQNFRRLIDRLISSLANQNVNSFMTNILRSKY